MIWKKKLIFGVGTNDVDYPVTIHSVIRGRRKKLWNCPFYVVWKSMLMRCYSAKFKNNNPAYTECSVIPEWHSLSVFSAWMQSQPWEGNQIDKDILFPGNKRYGPDTCVFVSGSLNLFLTDSRSARGEWPIGVCWDERRRKFRAQCGNPFTLKQDHIGYFDRPELAHEAWRSRKHEHAVVYAKQQTDTRIAAALMSRFA